MTDLTGGALALLFRSEVHCASHDDAGDARADREVPRSVGQWHDTSHDPAAHTDPRVAGIRAQDQQQFKALVEMLGPALIRFATHLVQSPDAAQDIVQDVLYRVWIQGDQFDPKVGLDAYLFTAVRRRALNVITHERMVQRSQQRIVREQMPMSADDYDHPYLHSLHQALETLTPHQRAAIDLRYNQSLTIAEIAEILGITPKGVERLMTRVRRLLRDYVLGPETP